MSKRKVSTDALETLGTIIDEHQKRDAIHLAVEPVIAGERFEPGDHIYVKDGYAFLGDEDHEPLGIVDPFLRQTIKKGQRFWFIMYPRMVHSLRHVWTHPAFPNPVEVREVQEKPSFQTEVERSRAWIENYITRS